MRNTGSWLTLFAAALLLAAPAHAASRTPFARPAPDPQTAPGDGTSSLLEAARNLPGARLAAERLAAAGYVRAPQADVAREADGRACVTLGFTDPANPSRAPLVVVRGDARLDPAATAVAAAVFEVDPVTGAIALTAVLPGSDEGVFTAAGAGGFEATGSFREKLVRWLQCATLACGAGGAGCVVGGALLGPLAPPVIAGCTIALCAIGSYACMW